ncbi:hypothetical protein SAMN05421788_10365 [Filimonas lacunae]|uniref:Uncharacterized protein n=1 Tax=Filimonas lacunae TaxID=477680 RepID=A0A173MJA7_9BACT|nr:hypothetical protein [Filimonas lacunae]BAV07715.1 hypothetical protein FLA_3746 [Filimonas lacunae]SIT03930.1 hypothetical protein SAMN05421788_10365 [Filimonas lacunae]
MRDIFEYYLKACNRASIDQTDLIFEFGDYYIVFSFEKIKDDDINSEKSFSPLRKNDISVIEALLIKVEKFFSFAIKGSEFLGSREDEEEGRSITNEMYILAKYINSYKQEGVQNLYVSVEYGDPLCDVDGDYIFTVEIVKELWWDIEFAKKVISFFDVISNVDVPSFYMPLFSSNDSLKDSKLVPILSTNTKTRRIGYFKILSLFLEEYKKVPVSSVNKKFENYCLPYREVLQDSDFKKGLVSETKTGISAKPYIDVASELEFLNRINNVFHTGKSFKVYQVLQKELSASEKVFELTPFDKMFFLECMLKADYFYFTNLLELIFIAEEVEYSYLILKFQNQLIRCLEDYKRLNLFESRTALQDIDAITNRIKKWENPEKYLEHLVMPRLNWMLDLGIIQENGKNVFRMTEIGNRLFKNLAIWNDINRGKVIAPNSFIEVFMTHIYDDCYNNSFLNNPTDVNLIWDKMYDYIKDSFGLFKTLAPNRVTASQAANYARYKLYFNDGIKVGYQAVLNRLSEKNQDKFIFKYQEQYQDGYVQIKN